MLEVADVLGQYGQAYLDAHGTAVPRRHRRAIRALVACRTAQLGGQLYMCDRCGHQRYAYHSCRNRHCPKCHAKDLQAWLGRRRDELLPVPYFHVVFTLPDALRRTVRQHPHVLYTILMRSADLSRQEQPESSEQAESLERSESLPGDRHDNPEIPPGAALLRCPHCHQGYLRLVALIPRGARDPPHA